MNTEVVLTNRWSHLLGSAEITHTPIKPGVTLPIMVLLDAIWLGLVARGFYKEQLGSILRSGFGWQPALLFYIVYAIAIAILVIAPSVAVNASTWRVIGMAAVLGLAAYGAYDFTNQATIKDWSMVVTVVDLAWGTFVTAASAGATYLIVTRLLGF